MRHIYLNGKGSSTSLNTGCFYILTATNSHFWQGNVNSMLSFLAILCFICLFIWVLLAKSHLQWIKSLEITSWIPGKISDFLKMANFLINRIGKTQFTLSLPLDTPYDIIIMWDLFMHVLHISSKHLLTDICVRSCFCFILKYGHYEPMLQIKSFRMWFSTFFDFLGVLAGNTPMSWHK